MLTLALALLQQPAPATAIAPVPDAPGRTYRVGPIAAPGVYRVAPAAGEDGDAAIAPAPPLPELARTGVTIEAYDKRVESRWSAEDPFYAATVRGGEAAAQSRQGPLDGGWTLADAAGRLLYALQLVDTGEGGVEGAWREVVAGPGAAHPEASGYIALISREPGLTVLRFLQPGAPAPTVVTLRPAPDGSWRGEVARASGPPSPVIARRR